MNNPNKNKNGNSNINPNDNSRKAIQERNQLDIFNYNANIPNAQIANNIMDFGRPNNSRDMNNSKKGSFEGNNKISDYTFNNYIQRSRNIPHPLDKPISSNKNINQDNINSNNNYNNNYNNSYINSNNNNNFNVNDNQINRKSNQLDFSQRMIPNISMPNPLNTQNSQFNPMFDRIPTIDTFNQKTKN